jgi:hypothetical protein
VKARKEDDVPPAPRPLAGRRHPPERRCHCWPRAVCAISFPGVARPRQRGPACQPVGRAWRGGICRHLCSLFPTFPTPSAGCRLGHWSSRRSPGAPARPPRLPAKAVGRLPSSVAKGVAIRRYRNALPACLALAAEPLAESRPTFLKWLDCTKLRDSLRESLWCSSATPRNCMHHPSGA